MPIVLRGILFVLCEGCSWRAIDAPEARWNSVYHYFRRWTQTGLWERVWTAAAPPPVTRTLFLDASHCKAHRSALNPPGGRAAQALGLTKGGWNTKLHALVDRAGIPRALGLSAGPVPDLKWAQTMVSQAASTHCTTLVADKGYDCDSFRCWLYEENIRPCIPGRGSRRVAPLYGRQTYRRRHVVENYFAKLKSFRRIATRYDKLAASFLAWVYLATILKLALHPFTNTP